MLACARIRIQNTVTLLYTYIHTPDLEIICPGREYFHLQSRPPVRIERDTLSSLWSARAQCSGSEIDIASRHREELLRRRESILYTRPLIYSEIRSRDLEIAHFQIIKYRFAVTAMHSVCARALYSTSGLNTKLYLQLLSPPPYIPLLPPRARLAAAMQFSLSQL